MRKIDLIIHPARFRILRALDRETLTTQEISDRLPDVPTSSIYRHLKLLLEGGVVEVAETQLVKGIQEKTYRLGSTAVLNAGDVAPLTAEEHVGYFTTYLLSLLHDFGAYVEAAEATNGAIDMLADRAGYREAAFYATPPELDAALAAMNEAFLPLIKHEPGNGRRRYKLATILHPTGENNE